MAIITQIKPVLGTVHTVGRLLDICLPNPVSFATINMQVSLGESVVTGYHTIRTQPEGASVKEELIRGWKTYWLEELHEKKGRGRPSTRVAYHFLIHLDDPPKRKALATALLMAFSTFRPLDMGRSIIIIPESNGLSNESIDISVLIHPITITRYAIRFKPNFEVLFQIAIESLFSLPSEDLSKVVKLWLSC